MHACGHDMHMTCWVGAARVLTALKDRWQGTLVFIAQPAEEIGAGARMMLEAGLLKVFPHPDFALALHCDSKRPHGTIAYTDGYALANVDRVEITVRGKGGHGARPHKTIDPIVLAARLILDLQTLVSRETSALEPAVVTVGPIHGGTEHNIIPDEVKLKLTVRSTGDAVRKHLLVGIKRKAEAAALGAEAPPSPGQVRPRRLHSGLTQRPPVGAADGDRLPGGVRTGQGGGAAARHGRGGLLAPGPGGGADLHLLRRVRCAGAHCGGQAPAAAVPALGSLLPGPRADD
jgi:metal-dependent amidase/aminoacylase/carboxypeptidase family protein